MIGLIYAIVQISGGVLLGITTLDKWDGESNFFNKIAGVLAPFQTVIGVALLILPLLRFKVIGLISIVGGILLLTHVFEKVPALETTLRQLSATLMPFKAIIGIALIVLGILGLF